MSSVYDTVKDLVVQTIAAITMTAEALRHGGDLGEDEINTVRKQSCSTDEMVRRSKQPKLRFCDDWGVVSNWGFLFRFFFEEEIVPENRKLQRGRSRKRRKTNRTPTNAARQVHGHIKESENHQTLPQKVVVIHDGLMMEEGWLEPERIEKPKRQLFRPAMLRMKPDWLRKRCKGFQRDPVYLIESIDTFDMIQELAAMKKQRHFASWQLCESDK